MLCSVGFGYSDSSTQEPLVILARSTYLMYTGWDTLEVSHFNFYSFFADKKKGRNSRGR